MAEKKCQAFWLGMVDYDAAWQMQIKLAEEISDGRRSPTLLLLEHPPVITIGRQGTRQHIRWSVEKLQSEGVEVREVDRGGDVTFHGPGQLVGYPLIPLSKPGWTGEHLPQADFTGYLRKLEQVLIQLLARLGIAAGQRVGLTGVWVPAETWARCLRCDPKRKLAPAKIASIGVKVDAHGISRHGFALNVDPNMSSWESVVPCGLEGVQMACIADFITPPKMIEIARIATEEFGKSLDYSMEFAKLG